VELEKFSVFINLDLMEVDWGRFDLKKELEKNSLVDN
jgi:hypothetical protein